jgi:hypothetical protein
MGLYDRVADLPLTIEGHERTVAERATSSGFDRATTTFRLHGEGETGMGEDVTYDTEEHERLGDHELQLAGSYTLAEFSAALEDVALFPSPPERESFYHYRRWAVESAALDLALRQADTDLASALERSYDPVRFVVSSRLSEGEAPPTTDRVREILERYPGSEFKLDPTERWTPAVVADLLEAGRVRVLDMKGQYHGTEVDTPANPHLYRLVIEGFPEAIIEDPALTEETEDSVMWASGRVSWDVPITGVDSIRGLPFKPTWLNIKPSRFGTVASLLDTVEHCLDAGIRMYGGGQFELGVGRGQIQALASLFYPESPNDVAPGGYNDPAVPEGLATSPLEPPADPVGFRWAD